MMSVFFLFYSFPFESYIVNQSTHMHVAQMNGADHVFLCSKYLICFAEIMHELFSTGWEYIPVCYRVCCKLLIYKVGVNAKFST